jgi:peptidoglycan biosynthesis protein MviN/MurJ (putative lipid II flippase)
MLWLLDRRLGGIGLRQSLGPISKMLIASGVMWIACIAVQYLPLYPQGDGKLTWATQLLILMTTGGAVYFGLCAMMGLSVMQHVLPSRSRHLQQD